MKPLQTAGRLSEAALTVVETGAEAVAELCASGKYLAQTATLHSAKLLGETWNDVGEDAKTGFDISQKLDQMRSLRVDEKEETVN